MVSGDSWDTGILERAAEYLEVVALQYYHIAKLVLAVSNRQPQVSGYGNLREGRKIEVRT